MSLYVYFRKIDDRLLLGGFRHLNPESESTASLETTDEMLQHLRRFLNETLFPNCNLTFEYTWSGTIGVGSGKNVIVREIEPRVFCAVRFGGMGVALSSLAAQKLSNTL